MPCDSSVFTAQLSAVLQHAIAIYNSLIIHCWTDCKIIEVIQKKIHKISMKMHKLYQEV